jgi:hypothetical protein
MELPALDPYFLPGGGTLSSMGSGVSVDLGGVATKGEMTKRFRIVYRRRVRYQRCTATAPPADASAADLNRAAALVDAGNPVDLTSNANETFDLRIEPEAIFRDDVNPTAASLRFEAFASGDVDGDGQISLDELRQIPIRSIRDAGEFEAGTYEVDDAGVLRQGKPIVIETLGDFVYELLVPTLLRFRGVGWCVGTVGRRMPD